VALPSFLGKKNKVFAKGAGKQFWVVVSNILYFHPSGEMIQFE